MKLNKTELTRCLEVIDWAATMPKGVSMDKIPVTNDDSTHIAYVVQGEPVAKTVGFVNTTNKQWEVEL